MKKYFLFDNEKITGGNYLKRILLQTILIAFFGLGFWLLAATAFKRAGTFGWKKEFRVLSAIFIPIVAIGNVLAKSSGYADSPTNLFDIISLTGTFFHLVLLFKNGNKIKTEQ
ncbi:hypothetical protein N8873_09515 [Flavobacteriaceae bacterium]|nr:hypothetical protein [Flavobacteriaceae bacterium]